jgi:hypothetical protein
MHTLVEGGADIIELGVPFSDPMADGPVIQRASERALQFGIGLRDVLQFVREFRLSNQTTPVVLMGYANPVERMGVETFISTASKPVLTACWSLIIRRKKAVNLLPCVQLRWMRFSCWRRLPLRNELLKWDNLHPVTSIMSL